MRTADYVINLVLSGVLLAGGYQLYFWCQRNTFFEVREFSTRIDEHIPYLPGWVWVYMLLYYPGIASLSFAPQSSREFARVAASFMLLIALQVAFFVVLPVRTPSHWRVSSPHGSLSERFLAFVQRVDAPSNTFPSMHASVAMLAALHLYDRYGIAVFAFPVLTGLSCVFTKQHYFIDVPAGAALGWFAFALHNRLLAP
jgi:membrane-associated phospholipid phosphatase